MARNTARSGQSGNFNFAQVPSVQIPRSVFNRSYGHSAKADHG